MYTQTFSDLQGKNENTFYFICPNVVLFVPKRVDFWVNVAKRSAPDKSMACTFGNI